jgi:uncharacterized iron-regulated protein
MNKNLSFLFVLSFLIVSAITFAQDKPTYLLYDKTDKTLTYKDLLQKASEADVVLFGETHNNPIAHWLQLQITKDLHKLKNGKLILGAEMFETDVQTLINEYFSGIIKESSFEKEARIWDNYLTDYKPLLLFAKQNQLSFFATNIPRRYASAVSANGLSILDKTDSFTKTTYFPTLPITVDYELPSYKNMLNMMGSGGVMHTNANNFVAAQAIKDATMAFKINQNFKIGHTFLHFNGAYHSDNYEGIFWYLKRYNPNLKIFTITVAEQDDITEVDDKNEGKADVIICVPSDMTKTY